ncbi:MAG: MarC family protein, partial [Phycisphaerae bacterium]
IFALLGVKFADFQIAGGILLVVLSLIDLLSRGKPAVDEDALLEHPDSTIGVVPLAVPLIVGPATLTTSLLLVNTYSARYAIDPMYGPRWGPILVVGMVCGALILNLLVLFAAMWHSDYFVRIIGKQAMAVMNKIVMILLAAIAVSLIRQGVMSIIAEARH